MYIPPLKMVKPKKRMIRQRSHPSPVLSGQFTVITVGSPSLSDSLIITTSSYGIPMIPLQSINCTLNHLFTEY